MSKKVGAAKAILTLMMFWVSIVNAVVHGVAAFAGWVLTFGVSTIQIAGVTILPGWGKPLAMWTEANENGKPKAKRPDVGEKVVSLFDKPPPGSTH